MSHFPLIRSKQGMRWAGGGYRGTLGFRKQITLQEGSAATVAPVALLCATKFGIRVKIGRGDRKQLFAARCIMLLEAFIERLLIPACNLHLPPFLQGASETGQRRQRCMFRRLPSYGRAVGLIHKKARFEI